MWTQQEAIDLCWQIEAICPACGCHVALTGGCLYKPGNRKDLDLIFYRIRQVEKIDMGRLFGELGKLNVHFMSGRSWCYKAVYGEKSIDLLFPEEQGEYLVSEKS